MLPTERGLRHLLGGAESPAFSSSRQPARILPGRSRDGQIRSMRGLHQDDGLRSRVDVPAVLLFLQNVHAALFADCRAIEAETRPSMVIFAAQRTIDAEVRTGILDRHDRLFLGDQKIARIFNRSADRCNPVRPSTSGPITHQRGGESVRPGLLFPQEGHDDLERDQDNDDRLQQFNPQTGRLVGQHLVGPLHHFQRIADILLPLG